MIRGFPGERATWLLRPIISEPNVQRINLSWFSQLGEALSPLTDFNFTTGEEGRVRVALLSLKPPLEGLIHIASTGSIFPLSLRSSMPHLRG